MLCLGVAVVAGDSAVVVVLVCLIFDTEHRHRKSLELIERRGFGLYNKNKAL